MSNRNIIADIMRGIGIILVIVGHTYAPLGIKYVICSFHMPLFFILSGYYFNKSRNVADVFFHGIKKLMMPYIITSVCVIVFQCGITFIQKGDVCETLITWIMAALYGLPGKMNMSNVYGIQRIGAIWFFEALFWAHFLLLYIYRLRIRWARPCIIISLLAIVICLSKAFWIPANIGTGVGALVFLYIGCLVREEKILDLESENWLYLAIPINAICVIIAYIKGEPFVPAYLQFPLYGFDIVGGVAGTYIVYRLSKYLKKRFCTISKKLAYMGKASSDILCVHLFDMDCLYIFTNRIPIGLFILAFRLIFDISIGTAIFKYKNALRKTIK